MINLEYVMKLRINVLIILFVFFCSHILAEQRYDIEETITEQPEQERPDCPPYQYTPWPLLFTGATTMVPLYATSSKLKPSDNLSEATSDDDYKVIQAKHDAVAYIATNGIAFHSAYLETALLILRKKYPNTSDLELAKAIIAY